MRNTYSKTPDKGDPSDVFQIFPRHHLQILCCRYWWLKKWEFKELAFPYWRIYHNTIDGARIIYNNKEYSLSSDKIILITPNTSFQSKLSRQGTLPHDFELEGGRVESLKDKEIIETTEGVLHLFIHFNLGIPYDNVSPGIFVFDLTDHLRDKISRIIEHLTEDYRRFNYYGSLAIQSLICDLLSEVPESLWDLRSNDHRILSVLGFIEKNLHQSLKNSELAQQAKMATNSFTRLFTTETGISPQRYVKKKRVEYACVLLHHTNRSIDQIATETGFADRFHFSRVFREITKTSPARYRKEYEITYTH
ncbi:helix-turn-helix domain-containing protein [Thermophagus sp. OGC60D27]|uniref:helix-turn-helix domain-containing protein n=1 Tax=Thermophagus sp. OGC60D27 TaxID=3458415 RepID=UPI0040380853